MQNMVHPSLSISLGGFQRPKTISSEPWIKNKIQSFLLSNLILVLEYLVGHVLDYNYAHIHNHINLVSAFQIRLI